LYITKLGEKVNGGIYKGDKTFINDYPVTDNTILMMKGDDLNQVIGILYGSTVLYNRGSEYKAWNIEVFDNNNRMIEFDMSKDSCVLFDDYIIEKEKLKDLIKTVVEGN